jgi:cytochrome c556
MSNKLLAAAVTCGIAALGIGQAPALASDPAADAATLIRARQSALMLSAVAFGGMKATIDSGGDVSSQAFAARALARWSKTLPSMFPAGTGKASGTPTKALDTIWTDRAGFEARATAYSDAAAKLAQLAEANDKPGFAAQWQVMRQTCSGCHDIYREAPPAPAAAPPPPATK